MSYETVVEQVRTLPEECLEDAAEYLDFLLYRHNRTNLERLSESGAEFEMKMRRGVEEMNSGRTTPLDEAFSEIRGRFA